MTIEEFLDFSIDSSGQKFSVYDLEKSEVIFSGYKSDCPDDILELEVASFDLIDSSSPTLCFNV